MVDEEEFPADLDVAEETGGDQGMQPCRRGLPRDVTSLYDRADAAIRLLEEHIEELCVPTTRVALRARSAMSF